MIDNCSAVSDPNSCSDRPLMDEQLHSVQQITKSILFYEKYTTVGWQLKLLWMHFLTALLIVLADTRAHPSDQVCCKSRELWNLGRRFRSPSNLLGKGLRKQGAFSKISLVW